MAEFQTVCRVDELAEGEGKTVAVGDKLIAVFRQDGRYFAIDDTCPHMGASLSGGCVENGDRHLSLARLALPPRRRRLGRQPTHQDRLLPGARPGRRRSGPDARPAAAAVTRRGSPMNRIGLLRGAALLALAACPAVHRRGRPRPAGPESRSQVRGGRRNQPAHGRPESVQLPRPRTAAPARSRPTRTAGPSRAARPCSSRRPATCCCCGRRATPAATPGTPAPWTCARPPPTSPAAPANAITTAAWPG